MGAMVPWCSNTSDLFQSFSNSSHTCRTSPSDYFPLQLKKGDPSHPWTPFPVSAAAAHESRFKNSTHIHENSLHPFLRHRRFSSSLPLRIRGGLLGCFSELRFKELTDSIERRPFNLSRRYRYIYKVRVICAATREEDGGRSYSSQEADHTVDHYKVLGLRRQATASAIKLAYRQLARQLHPDVNKDLDANEKFMSVRLAYEVLSDETSRKLYDSSWQEQVKASRRKQVYQRRERDTWSRSRHNKDHYRRGAPYEHSYSVYSYENLEYSNMESYYYTYPTSGIFSNNNKRKSSRSSHSNRGKAPDMKQRKWQVELQSLGREALLFLWVVSALWHALGAKITLALLVGSLALWKDFAVGYRLASGVAWLMGGEKGLALMVALIVITRVFGRAYHAVAAIVALALWLGGGVLKAVPLPHGAILVLVYKCIQLQSSM